MAVATLPVNVSFSETVGGLRDQILANATVLYPQLVARASGVGTTGSAKPTEEFQVIVHGNGGDGSVSKRAVLLYGPTLTPKPISRGPLCHSVEKALRALLDVLVEALGWYSETLFGGIKNCEECAGGQVDLSLVQEGYHFAAVQRWEEDTEGSEPSDIYW